MSLPLLVAQEQWTEFDQAWKDRMSGDEGIDEVLDAIAMAGQKKRVGRCVPLAMEHAELLEAAGRLEDAARVVGAVLIHGGNPSELNDTLQRLSEQAFSSEGWWPAYREFAGIQEGSPDLRGPWRAFEQMRSFQKGRLVHHPGGWGVGEVQGVDADKLEVDVLFASGKRDRFPMNAAVEIFKSLPETDLRAQYYRQGEDLKKSVKKDPLEVLRNLCAMNGSQITTNQIKTALLQIGIEGSAWSAWWRKARKLAENSEWFEVVGTPQRSIIRLLSVAKDTGEALRRTLNHAGSVAEVHSKVRDLFASGQPDEKLTEVALEELERWAALESEPLEERLAAWLMLRDQRGATPEPVMPALEPVLAEENPADPSNPPALWALFQTLPGAKDQERAVGLLPEIFGEDWMDRVLPHLQHAASGMVRPLVDTYAKAKREQDLLDTYAGLLARPLRSPVLMTHLAATFEKKDLDEGFPTGPQRAQALLALSNHLFSTRRGNPGLTRVCARLTDVLAKGKNPLLRKLLGDSDAASLRAAAAACLRGVDPEVDHMVTEIALDHDRHFFAGQTGPFWQGDTIWTTKPGLERRSGELKELREVKIPANAEAIGRAASYGDLSENSEWEAAMEEQRNLTRRAMEIETELRLADLLEHVAMPEETVCPGTQVTYREVESGKERTVAILGPWDGDQFGGMQVVSYRAPLAAGLLGSKPGDRRTVTLPSGELDIEVLAVEPLELD